MCFVNIFIRILVCLKSSKHFLISIFFPDREGDTPPPLPQPPPASDKGFALVYDNSRPPPLPQNPGSATATIISIYWHSFIVRVRMGTVCIYLSFTKLINRRPSRKRTVCASEIGLSCWQSSTPYILYHGVGLFGCHGNYTCYVIFIGAVFCMIHIIGLINVYWFWDQLVQNWPS